MHPDLAPLDSVGQAGWFVDTLSDALIVGGLVPPAFEAYVRILHPAADEDGRPVRWAEVAEDQDTTLHAAAQFPYLARRRSDGRARGWRGDDPAEGSLDRETLETLVAVLAGHTTTAETIWLHLWDGWGGLPRAWAGAPLVRQGGGYRDYHAFRCPLDAVVELSVRFGQLGWEPEESGSTAVFTSVYVGDGDPEHEPPPRHPHEHHADLQSPQQWWPDDRAWAVATEIDDDSTIVAGSDALAAALEAHPELETFRMAWPDSLHDNVNAAPRRRGADASVRDPIVARRPPRTSR